MKTILYATLSSLITGLVILSLSTPVPCQNTTLNANNTTIINITGKPKESPK